MLLLRQLAAGCSPHRHGFNTRHFIWNLWWKKRHWGVIFSQVPPFPLSILFHQMLSILSFIFRQRNVLLDFWDYWTKSTFMLQRVSFSNAGNVRFCCKTELSFNKNLHLFVNFLWLLFHILWIWPVRMNNTMERSDRKRSQYIWGTQLWPLSGGAKTNQEKRNDCICITIGLNRHLSSGK